MYDISGIATPRQTFIYQNFQAGDVLSDRNIWIDASTKRKSKYFTKEMTENIPKKTKTEKNKQKTNKKQTKNKNKDIEQEK